jgi:flagellin
MTRINTNVPSLIAQRNLGINTGKLENALERLSTGLRINRGKDDPAGLIASEALRSEIRGLDAAISNAERADQVVNIAEGGLQEISNLLVDLQGLVTQSANEAGLSVEEKEANQLQLDSILQTIDRVAAATSFQGTKLLNGQLDYVTRDVSSVIADFDVRGAKLEFEETRDVDVVVTASAQRAGYFLSFGDANLNLGGAGADDGRTEQFVLELAGTLGARELSFNSGTALADVAGAINGFTSVTGVSAVVSGTGIRLDSTGFGSEEFVSVTIADDGAIGTAADIGLYDFEVADALTASTTLLTTFANARNAFTDRGQDVEAVINGIRSTTRGTVARISTDFLDIELDLRWDTSGPAGPNAAKLGAIQALTITDGGADFQLASRVNIAGKVSLGISNVAARALGRTTYPDGAGELVYHLADLASGRDLNVVDGNRSRAQDVVNKAIRSLASLRGRLGAFQSNTIGATINSLGVSLENTTAAESVIRDTDFADETSRLTQAQVLQSSALSSLAIANNAPQNVLQLLG